MKKKILIVVIVVLLILSYLVYDIFFKIDLKQVEMHYQNNQFYTCGKDCNSYNTFFNKKLRKYKIAREYGSLYEYYQEEITKYGTTDEEHIKEELNDLFIELYWNSQNYSDTSEFSKEEKEVIEHINNLHYMALKNKFGISKEDVKNILNKYNTGDGPTDIPKIRKELETHAQRVAVSTKEKIEIENNPIEISNTKLTSNTLYSILEGSVTNRSSKTVYFVKIKVLFMDDSKKTIDTDWTYAVGSEGLAPGESKKFETSVKKDISIRYSYPSVIDFNY